MGASGDDLAPPHGGAPPDPAAAEPSSTAPPPGNVDITGSSSAGPIDGASAGAVAPPSSSSTPPVVPRNIAVSPLRLPPIGDASGAGAAVGSGAPEGSADGGAAEDGATQGPVTKGAGGGEARSSSKSAAGAQDDAGGSAAAGGGGGSGGGSATNAVTVAVRCRRLLGEEARIGGRKCVSVVPESKLVILEDPQTTAHDDYLRIGKSKEKRYDSRPVAGSDLVKLLEARALARDCGAVISRTCGAFGLMQGTPQS